MGRVNNEIVSPETRSKMSKSHTGLKESADTKRKKSNPIITFNNQTVIVCDSAKLFADYLGPGIDKTHVTKSVKSCKPIRGFQTTYFDYFKRKEIPDWRIKYSSEFLEVIDLLDNKDVETIESKYEYIELRY